MKCIICKKEDGSTEISIKAEQTAIVKIAYELGYYCFGNEYLNDKTGEMLRKVF